MPVITPRGRARRELLLNATAQLVAAKGFHAVGILEIGAAAGVSSAAIYRHFANKQELLVALIDRVIDELLAGGRAVVADAPDAETALRGLVARHVEFALRDRAIITVYDQEAHNLPEEPRRRLRRNQRLYADLWVDAVAVLRPEWDRAHATAAVHAVFGLLNSVADYQPRLSEADAAWLLVSLAESAFGLEHSEAHASAVTEA
jgi:AcrR family transcriptional regulator